MISRILLLGLIVAASTVAGFLFHQLRQEPAGKPVSMEAQVPRSGIPPAEFGVVGKQRPDFSLPDMAGNLRNVAEWDGSVLAINFWASWCLPCLKEIPELVELQARYASSGFQVLGIALQKPEELVEFIADKKMNYPVLAGEAPVIEVAENYGNLIGVLPYTAIIDRAGDIVYVKAGPMTGEQLETIITPLL